MGVGLRRLCTAKPLSLADQVLHLISLRSLKEVTFATLQHQSCSRESCSRRKVLWAFFFLFNSVLIGLSRLFDYLRLYHQLHLVVVFLLLLLLDRGRGCHRNIDLFHRWLLSFFLLFLLLLSGRLRYRCNLIIFVFVGYHCNLIFFFIYCGLGDFLF